MGVKTTSKVWEWSMSEGNDRLVLLALADWADDDGYCFPGIKRVAQRCRISERTVQRCIRTLEKMGEVLIEVGAGLKTDNGYTNRYRLVIKPNGCQIVAGMTAEAVRGDKTGRDGVTSLSPNPSVEPSDKPLVAAGGKAKPFQKPLMPEIVSYATEIGLTSIDAEAFYDHHEARAWKLGREIMKDWRAALRTWKRNAERFAPAGRTGAARPKNAHISNDSVWHGILESVIRDYQNGEDCEYTHVIKQIRRASEYATALQIADHFAEQIGQIPKSWYEFIVRLPGKGTT